MFLVVCLGGEANYSSVTPLEQVQAVVPRLRFIGVLRRRRRQGPVAQARRPTERRRTSCLRQPPEKKTLHEQPTKRRKRRGGWIRTVAWRRGSARGRVALACLRGPTCHGWTLSIRVFRVFFYIG